MVGWLVGWLVWVGPGWVACLTQSVNPSQVESGWVDWLVGRLVGWLAGWLVGCLVDLARTRLGRVFWLKL
jgi:hypothetical protein